MDLSLNRSGTTIWNGLREGQAPEQIAAALARRYGKPVDDVEADVRRFVCDLEKRGLVRLAG